MREAILCVLFVLTFSVSGWASSCSSDEHTVSTKEPQAPAGVDQSGQSSAHRGALVDDFILFGYILGGEERVLSSGQTSLVVDLGSETWKRPCPRARYAFRVNATMYAGKAGVVTVIHEDPSEQSPHILWRDAFIVQDGGALELDINMPVITPPTATIGGSTLAAARTIRGIMATALAITVQPFGFCVAKLDNPTSICSIYSRPLVLARSTVVGNVSFADAASSATGVQASQPTERWMYQCHQQKCDVYSYPSLSVIPVHSIACDAEYTPTAATCQLLHPRRVLLCMTAGFILVSLSLSHFHVLTLAANEPFEAAFSHDLYYEGYGSYEHSMFRHEEASLLASMWNRDKNGRLIRNVSKASSSDAGRMVLYRSLPPRL